MKNIFFIALLLFSSSNLFAITYFDSLTTDYELLAFDSVINSYKIKHESGITIKSALDKKIAGTLASRLFDFSAWMIMRKQGVEKTLHQLDKRELSMLSPDTFSFISNPIEVAGDKESLVKIVAYANTSCPLCKMVLIPLHMAVTDGPLKGIATLEIRPMTTSIGDKGLLTASKQGKAWDYYLSFENEKRRLTEKIILSNAKSVGIKIDSFKKSLSDPETMKLLNSFRHEAMVNGVSVTPTLFINNRRYQSYKDPQWVIDAAEFEYEQLKRVEK